MAVIQILTNSETSKIRMKTPMKHCYSKRYSPESFLDYEWQVMLQRSFVVVFAVSEFVLQPLSDAYKTHKQKDANSFVFVIKNKRR